MQTKTHTSLTLLTATATLLSIGALIPTAHAANTWDGGAADGNWNSLSNWDDNVVPATSNSLTFSGDVQTSTTNDIVGFTAGRTNALAQAITFGNTGAVGTNAFTLAGNQISLVGGSGAGGSIISSAVTVGSITDTISLNLSFGGTATISTGTAHNLIITGLLTQASGTRQFIKTGSGELILRNAGNNYLGTTTVNSGILTVDVVGGIQNAGVASALGAGTSTNSQINFAGGTLNVTLGAGSTDRQVRIGSTTVSNTAGANINNNSTNGGTPLVFSNAAFNVSAGAITAARTLSLGGTNTDANEISGVISDNNTGGGGLIRVTKLGTGRWILSGANTYSGNTTVSAGALQLATSGSLRFVIGSSGVNNAVTGTGTTTMNGQFVFDLTGASTNTDATWAIVAASLNPTYGTGFSVAGFIEDGLGNWNKETNGVRYIFSQSSSVLSVQSLGGVTPYNAWVSSWPGFIQTAPTDDPDGDGYNNNMEFAFGGNPTSGTGAFLSAALVGSDVVISYVAMTTPNAVTYQVQSTTDLSTGEWSNLDVTIRKSGNQEGISQPSIYERKEFLVPTTAREFYRVQATIAP